MSDEPARGGQRDAETLRRARSQRRSPEEAARALASGDAWREFCHALERAGEHLFAAGAGASETTRAEGVLYLLGLVRGGLGQALELRDPARPRFFRNPDSLSRWGAENADNQYLWVRVDPSREYRIRGSRGNAFDFLLEVKEGYMQLGDERNFATLDARDLAVGEDGSFEIRLGGAPGAGNHVPLDPDARYVAIRQYLCDWEQERPVPFTIECVDPDPPRPPTASEVAAALQDAGDWTLGTALTWTEWTDRMREGFDPCRIAPARKFAGGADDIYYGNDLYRLGPDEAMILEAELPRAHYWQFQLGDLWFRSADWGERKTSINPAQAAVDADGRFRCVIAHRDPGVLNWLDTAGEPEGLVQYRYLVSEDNPHPRSKVVPFESVREHLPEGTARCTPEERARELAGRRRHRQLREPVT